jgi:protein-disulfide isomerase
LKKVGSMVHERFDGKSITQLPFTGLALLALLVGAFAASCSGADTEPQTGDEERASAELDHPSLGDANAPVVLTEYADYQ